MKRIALFTFLIVFSLTKIIAENNKNPRINLALTGGFIWKHDTRFKKIYGQGIPDITLDGCYYFNNAIGMGIKGSFRKKNGKTTVLHQPTKFHEFPLIGYVRGIVGDKVQFYISAGGGIIFVHEKSYIGDVKTHAPGAELETGLNFNFFDHFYITGAFRALFFNKNRSSIHTMQELGGYGIRAGIGLSF